MRRLRGCRRMRRSNPGAPPSMVCRGSSTWLPYRGSYSDRGYWLNGPTLVPGAGFISDRTPGCIIHDGPRQAQQALVI
jgi:hypothetical protein